MQGLNQLLNLVQNPLANISNPFFSIHPNPKIKGSSHKKKIKSFFFSKMAQTILIKFCGLIVHSKPNNVILANFSGKIPETGKICLKFFLSPNVGPKPTH